MIASSNDIVDLVNVLIPIQLSRQFLPSKSESGSSPLPASHSSSENSERSRSVLVIDDVSDVTDMLTVLLTHAGYDVTAAASALEAISLAQDHQFDLIISDIGMPEMNGYELAQALRSQAGYEVVPMVALTGFSMFDDRNRSLMAGFNAHVTKPIDPRRFLDLIEQL